jgi:hypothetical protein
MMCNHRFFKAKCWLCVGLALSTCTYEVCLAQPADQKTPPDSLNGAVEPSVEEIMHTLVNEDAALVDAPVDTLGSDVDTRVQPVYRKWWAWALVTTGIAVIAVLAGGGEAKKTEEDLPGFPDPPNR